jgi:hypothetical protein
MKKSYETFRRNFENAKRIWNLEEDWITPVEYLPYIDALLGDIDLDPCSTWGFFIYLPPPSLSVEPARRFRDIFSNIGKIIN